MLKDETAAPISFRNRAGWLRVWLVASTCWCMFVVYHIIADWESRPSIVLSRPLIATADAARAIEQASIESRSQCVDRTITTQIYDHPKDNYAASTVLEQSRATRAWILSNKRFSAAEPIQPEQLLTGRSYMLTVSCFLESTLLRNIVEAAAVMTLPPLAIPLMGILIFIFLKRLTSWVLAGFRAAPNNNPVQSTRTAQSKSLTSLGREIKRLINRKLHSSPDLSCDIMRKFSFKPPSIFSLWSYTVFLAWLCTPAPAYAQTWLGGQILAGFHALGFATPVAIVIWGFSRYTRYRGLLPLSGPGAASALSVGLLKWGGTYVALRGKGLDVENAHITALLGWQGVLIAFGLTSMAYLCSARARLRSARRDCCEPS